MKVELVDCLKYTTICRAARIPYKGVSDNGGVSDTALVKKCIKKGHESVVEHSAFCFEITGVSRALTHQQVRHRIASYCLSGDTTVVAFKASTRAGSKKWTMKQLYEMSRDPKTRSRLKMIRLRSVNEDGILVPNKIVSIVNSGQQPVYKVTARSGRVIKATAAHRFLTTDGYKPLSAIAVGDSVVCNGLPAHQNPEWIREHYLARNMERSAVARLAGVSDACMGVWIRKFGLQKPKAQYPNRQPGYGVKGMFSGEALHTLSTQKMGDRNPMYKGADASEAAGRRRCQKAFHHGQGVLSVFSDPIISIEEVGVEDTYDIEMAAPYHNFVAEGFVVHNSQESQRYVKTKEPSYIVPPSISEHEDGYIRDLYEDTMEVIWDTYNRLLDAGVKKEDARFVFPNATTTKIMVTMNLRALINFLKLRMAKDAQWEIREMAQKMYNSLPPEFQSLVDVALEREG